MESKTESGRVRRRMKLRFEGHVQGVGFRYTAVDAARPFDVTGYVRNEMDGSVLVVAEGFEDQLLGFHRAIKLSHLGRHITGEQLGWSAATGEFSVFGISHDW